MKPNRRNPLFSNFFRGNTLAPAVVFSLTASHFTQAAPLYWDGTGTGWNAATAWSTGSGATIPDPGAVPGIADVATFNISTVNTAQTVNLNAAQSALGLSFVSSGTVAIQGGGTANQTLTLAGSGIAKTGTGAITIGSATTNQGVPISLSASQTWSNSNDTGAIVINNGVAPSAAAARTLTLGGTSTAANQINGVIADNGTGKTSLTKIDAGLWVLGNMTAIVNNTFTGNVTINGGTLRVETPVGTSTAYTGLGTGNTVTVNSGATLHFKSASTTNTHTYANTTALSSGTVFFEDANTILSGNMSLAGSNTFNGRYNNKNLTISGVISGVGGFTKTSTTDNGTLELILTGNNTFSSAATGGVMTVNRGYVRLGSAGAMGSTPVILANNNWGAGSTVGVRLANNITIGAGRTLILRNGPGTGSDQRTALDNVSGNNTWAGNIVLESPVSTIRNQTAQSSSGTLTIDGNILNSPTLPSAGMFFRGVGSGVMNGNFLLGSGQFLKTDTGNWTINSTGNTQASTTIAVGSVTVNNTNALEPGRPLLFGQGDGNSATLTINGGFSQNFSAIDNATNSNGAHLITGAGSLDVGASGIPITVNDGTAANDLTIATAVTGAGGFTKGGVGNLNLNAATVSGPVTLNVGSLSGNATLSGGLTVNTGASLVPGSASTVGAITASTLAFSGTNSLNVNLGSAGSDSITVSNSGGLTQSGTTTINVAVNGSINAASTFYPVINYTGASPGTSGFLVGPLPGHVLGTVTDNGSAIGITATSDKIVWTGTTDGNWDVNTTPNFKLLSSGTPTNYLTGDDVIFNNDGIAQNSIALVGTIDARRVEFAHTSGTYTLASGTLAGNGDMPLDVTGGGSVVLRNTNTYTGPTTINSGILELDNDGGTLSASSGVSVAPGSTFKLTDDDGSFNFDRPLSGSGTVRVNLHTSALGTTAAQSITLTGAATGFTGSMVLESPSVGSQRLIASSSAAGAAAFTVENENQLYIATNNTYANNITLTGNGYDDALGSIGALRSDGGTWNGNISVTGIAGDSGGTTYDARIGGSGGTTTFNGAISGGDLQIWGYGTSGISHVFTAANSFGDLIIGGSDNNSAGGQSAVIIGDNAAVPANTTATLGTGNVYLITGSHATDPKNAILRIGRADGYSLPGNIIGSASNATGWNRLQFRVDTTGTGLSLNGKTVDLSNGTNGGVISVGTNANGSILNIGTGSTVDVGTLFAGDASGIAGTVNFTDGTASVINQVRFGHFPNNTSVLNMSGGSLTITANPPSEPSAAAEVNGVLYAGNDGTGVINHSGGTINVPAVVLDNRGATGGADQYNLSASGLLELRSSYGIVGRNTDAIISLGGGTIKNVGSSVDVAINATNITSSGTTILDTNGATNKFSLMGSITGSGTITTSGGGVIELEPDSNTTKTSVSNGTGTQSISAILAGGSAFTKIGSGTTTLSAANTYTGATTVSAGRLNLTGSAASSAMSLANNTSLGGEGTVASLTLGAAGTDTTSLFVDGTTTGALTSTGTLTVNGPATAAVNVNLSGLPATPGTITVLNHGGTGATAAQFALVNSGNYRGGTFNVTSSAVTLDIASKNLVWDGTTATWEIGGTENDWNDTANDNFFNGDKVTFNDTFVTADQTVTMSGGLQPAAVVVANDTYNYTLAGSGIGGTAGITKSGAMNLTLGGDNTFSGGLTINDGMVNIGAANTGLGAAGGQITVNTGGQFNFKGFSPIAGRTYSFTIAGDGADGYGDGAITNDTAGVLNNSRVQNLTLSDDATIGTFGGTLPQGNRLDVGSGGTITGNGNVLTKVGDAMLTVRGPATDISYLVKTGTLRAEDSDLALGSTGLQVNAGATLDSYGNRTFAVPVTFQSGSFLSSSNSTANWTGLLTLQGDVNIGGAGNVNIVQPFAETATGLFTKSGAGTTILPAGNTFNRKFVVDAGILRIPTNDALGVTPGSPLADSITLQNGGRIQAGNATAGVDFTLDTNRGITLAAGDGGFHSWTGFTINYAGAITGPGNLTKTDGGILNFTGTSDHTGTTALALGTTNLNGAVISSTSSLRVGTTANTSPVILNINSGTSVTTGRLVLSDQSNITSTVNQTGGTLTITGTDNTNTTSASFLLGHWGGSNNATYNLSGGILNSVGAELSFGWDSSAAVFNQTGGTANLLGLDFANGRNNSAVYTLSGGRLNIGANGITANTNKMLVLTGGTIGAMGADWTSSQAITTSASPSAPTFDTLDSTDSLTPRTITLNGVISGTGGLTKANEGALLIGGTNTYQGVTTVNGGTLRIQGTGKVQSTSAITVNAGATLQTASTNFFVLDHGTAVPASRVITVNGGTWVMESGDYRLGNVTLSNGATWTSNTTTDWGVLLANTSAGAATVTVSGTGASVMDGTGSIRMQGVQNFDVADVTSSSAADLTVTLALLAQGNAAGAAGGINKTGAGTMVLGGINTYVGNTTVNAGTLHLADDARLTFVIGAASGTNNSISGSGTAVLDGDFAIDTTAAAALTAGSWTLEDVSSLTGAYGFSFRVVNPDGSAWANSGDTWTKTVGTKTWTFVENTGILTVAESGYASWAALHAGGGIASGDYDGDGVANGLEWVLGGDETTRDLGKLPAVSTSGGNLIFTFYRDQESINPDTTVTIEVGTSLTGWPDVYAVPATAGTSGSPGTVTVTKDSPVAGTDKVELSVAQSPDTKKFARLKVTITP